MRIICLATRFENAPKGSNLKNKYKFVLAVSAAGKWHHVQLLSHHLHQIIGILKLIMWSTYNGAKRIMLAFPIIVQIYYFMANKLSFSYWHHIYFLKKINILPFFLRSNWILPFKSREAPIDIKNFVQLLKKKINILPFFF